jgi:hypothetical protein
MLEPLPPDYTKYFNVCQRNDFLWNISKIRIEFHQVQQWLTIAAFDGIQS